MLRYVEIPFAIFLNRRCTRNAIEMLSITIHRICKFHFGTVSKESKRSYYRIDVSKDFTPKFLGNLLLLLEDIKSRTDISTFARTYGRRRILFSSLDLVRILPTAYQNARVTVLTLAHDTKISPCNINRSRTTS